MYQRLPKSDPKNSKQLEKEVVPDSDIQIAFRQLRDQLEEEGQWERDLVLHEAKLLGIWTSLVVGAIATAHSIPAVSVLY